MPALLVTLAVAGIVLGLRVAGPSNFETPLGDVRVAVVPAFDGQVDAYVPLADWGVRARAFDGPLELRGEIRSVQREAVLRAATGEGEIIEDTRASTRRRGGRRADARGAVRDGRRGRARRRRRAVPRRDRAAPAPRARRRRGRHRRDRGADHRRQRAGGPRDVRRRGVPGPELLRARRRAAPAPGGGEQDRGACRALPGDRRERGALVQPAARRGRRRAGGRLPRRGRGWRRARSSPPTCTTTRWRSESLEALGDGDEPVFFVGDFAHQGSEGEARPRGAAARRARPARIAVSGNHDSALLMRRLAASGITVLTGSAACAATAQPPASRSSRSWG